MLRFLTILIIFWGKYEAFLSFPQNILWYKIIIFFKAFASEKWWKRQCRPGQRSQMTQQPRGALARPHSDPQPASCPKCIFPVTCKTAIWESHLGCLAKPFLNGNSRELYQLAHIFSEYDLSLLLTISFTRSLTNFRTKQNTRYPVSLPYNTQDSLKVINCTLSTGKQ